jgi:phosphohistidine phosphatase
MNLYLIRHSIAEESARSGRDADRALTDDGKERMGRAAEGLRAAGVRLELVLTSPYRRAIETAEIVAAALGGVECRELPELAAGAIPATVLAELRHYRTLESLALVGHQPDLGHLASQILTGSADVCPIAFKKGSVACFEIETPRMPLRGELSWLLTPKHLRALSR